MKENKDHITKLRLSVEEWRARLTTEQYHIMREKGTEHPCSGKLPHTGEKGTYVCAGCRLPLFSSREKFESGTGWPSFTQPIREGNILYQEDNKLRTPRVEALCACCESHLGHVFDDGPIPSHKRYCINSLALEWEPERK